MMIFKYVCHIYDVKLGKKAIEIAETLAGKVSVRHNSGGT